MRGTEPFEDGSLPGLPTGVDLISADIGQIGILGLALTQVVSMANYVMRLRTPRGDDLDLLEIRGGMHPSI
jgi:hypothetical protein